MKTIDPAVLSLQQRCNRLSNEEHINEQLVCCAWQLAKACLWPRDAIAFTDAEISKDFIRNYLHLNSHPKKSFESFCTRILLTKEYFQLAPKTMVAPQEWLTANNDEGFSITLSWYKDLLWRRECTPEFRQDITDFTSFYLQYCLQPCYGRVREYRKVVRSYNAPDLLSLLSKLIHS